MEARAQEYQAKVADLTGRYDRDVTLAARGITDDEVRDAFTSAYSRRFADAKERPAFADAVKAWAEKPDEAPPLRRPFLAPAQAGAGGEQRAATERPPVGQSSAGPAKALTMPEFLRLLGETQTRAEQEALKKQARAAGLRV
jgi:hypothetical protein